MLTEFFSKGRLMVKTFWAFIALLGTFKVFGLVKGFHIDQGCELKTNFGWP